MKARWGILIGVFMLASGQGFGQEEVRHENTVNYAASHRGEPVTLVGEVISENPVKGSGTVYVLLDKTGRRCEVRTKAAFPEIGTEVRLQGKVVAERAYSGDMAVFIADKQEVLSKNGSKGSNTHSDSKIINKKSSAVNYVVPLLIGGAIAGVVVLGLLVALLSRRRSNGFNGATLSDSRPDMGDERTRISLFHTTGAYLQVIKKQSGQETVVNTIPVPLHDSVVFGRKPDGMVCIRIDDPCISRNHGELCYSEDTQTWTLRLLLPTNETYHNKQRLEPGDEVTLNDGDRIQIGNEVVLKFQRHAEPDEQGRIQEGA